MTCEPEPHARFDRERIPERVVHARGTGAFGTFESTSYERALTRASLFAKPGEKVPVAVAFSSVIHPRGAPDPLHDPRGFAAKFYTKQGNYDLVGDNLPHLRQRRDDLPTDTRRGPS